MLDNSFLVLPVAAPGKFAESNVVSFKINKAPRRKQRGIKSALQTAGFQPAFAPRGEELNPEEIKIYKSYCFLINTFYSGKLMRNLFSALVVILLCSAVFADEKKKEGKHNEESPFIILHCVPNGCEQKSSTSPNPQNCSFAPEDQVYRFYRKNTNKQFPPEINENSDGIVEIEVESSTFTNDSLFSSYSKKEITGYKDGHKKSTVVFKTEVNRLTGAFEYTEHSSVELSSKNTGWSTQIVRGSCISKNSVKDNKRKF